MNEDLGGTGSENLDKRYILFITVKPNFRSYIAKGKTYLWQFFNDFMINHGELKFIDGSTEVDTKGVFHIHAVVATADKNIRIQKPKGFYIDVKRILDEDLDDVLRYVNKHDKYKDVVKYYEYNYGFIDNN